MERNTLLLIQKILKRLNREVKQLDSQDSISHYFEIKMYRKIKKMIATEVKRSHNLDPTAKVLIHFIEPPNGKI
jgi:hypothetical protein